MSVARAVLNTLELPMLSRFIGQEIVTTSDLFSFTAMKQTGTAQYSYNRELTLGTTNQNLPILPNGTWSESSPTFTRINDTAKKFGQSAYVPLEGIADPNIYGPIVGMKAKALARSVETMLISGSGVDPEWTGLYNMCSGSATQDLVIATVGSGSLSLAKLNTLFSAVKAGKPSFVVMATQDRDTLLGLITATYTPSFISNPFDATQQTLVYNGVPVIVSDYIAGDTVSTVASSRRAYAVFSDPNYGVTLWYNQPGDLVRQRIVPVNQSDMSEVQIVSNMGFSNHSSLAVACLRGII